MIKKLAMLLSILDYNTDLSPSTFIPSQATSFASETGHVSELLLAIENTDLRDDLYMIHKQLIEIALNQNVSCTIYPVYVHSRDITILEEKLSKDFNTSNIKIVQDYFTSHIWIRDYGAMVMSNGRDLVDYDYFDKRPVDDYMSYHYALTNLINLKISF